jgi:Mrp family chromosome partitioning ATPase
MPSHRFWKRKRVLTVDELGGTADGALLIVGSDGAHLHVTSPSVAKSLRFLLARVQTSDANGLPGRVALTSALRGEGVSYITRSLATVISYDTDASVCLVDLNWKNPPPANAKAKAKAKAAPTETDTRPTLAEAVEQGLDVTEIVHPTANPRLSFVAPGIVARPRRPAMASSRALEDVIDKLAEQFDHLLLDLPSVLASSDALTLAQLADAYLLVVQQGVTSASQVQGALDELEARKPLGIVLNRFESNVPARLRKLVGG